MCVHPCPKGAACWRARRCWPRGGSTRPTGSRAQTTCSVAWPPWTHASPAWADSGAPESMPTLLRLLRILYVAFRYGLDDLVLSSLDRPLARGLRWTLRLGMRPRAPRGLRLRRALESLGPIFVKFGQMLSTRRDLIPADIADELALLQDRVPPFPSAQAAA